MRTILTERLGCDVPIIQAPIGRAAGPELAAAVSNAGGIGIVALTGEDDETIVRALRQTKALTLRPFGINLILAYPCECQLTKILEEGVPIVSLFWGDPAPLVKRIHAAGAVVMFQTGSAEEAKRAADCGVDVIVAQGWEAGGHIRGNIATLPLIPSVVDAVAPTPVVAAGGIVNGRGLAAALALGAVGAWIGTRFLASYEARTHHRYRERVLQATETDTVYTELFDVGWPKAPHRVIRNNTLDAWDAAGRPASGERPGEGGVIAASPIYGEIMRYEFRHGLRGYSRRY